MPNDSHPSVVMIAGEASGDLHGAHLIHSLRKRYGQIQIAGAGGNAMASAGAEIVVHIRELSVMGFTAIFGKAPQLLKAVSQLKQLIAASKPDLLLLIDFPDFNLHLAGYAKKIGIPVLYYISPQLWAWRSRRVYKIKRRVDHMAVILPFEEHFYKKYDVPVTFVGHPLMDAASNHIESAPLPRNGRDPFSIAMLPGSREGEVTKLLPKMLAAVHILKVQFPDIRILISRAPTIESSLIEEIIQRSGLSDLEITGDSVDQLFQRSHLAVVTSGTASLEAAIFGIPTILVYAMSQISFTLGKLLIRVPHIGLANLIAQDRIIPELIQEDANADNIASHVLELLTDPEAYRRMQAALSKVKKLMGKPGASDRVAGIVARMIAPD